MPPTRSATHRYALFGGLFGLCFPVGATLLDVALRGLPATPAGLLQAQVDQPLLWIIDTAPFFLGVFAALAGRRQDQVARLNAELGERVRARTAQLEAANEAKGAFLAHMSHELRTPMTAILGYADLLEDECSGPENASTRADLGRIRDAGKHLLGLIDDILDLSKVEAGQIDVEVRPVDVAALVEAAAGTVRPLVERGGNAFVVDCRPDVGVLASDPTRLRQILMNLLSNAAKFTSNGTVRIEAERARGAAGDRIVLRVHDSGIGMTPEQLARVFDPFRQADSSTTRRYGGTGLGLTISQRLAERLGGTLTGVSRPGAGSVFTLDLPAEAPPAPPPALRAGRNAGAP